MLVKDFMSPCAITIEQGKTVLDAAQLMVKEKISILPVVDTDKNLLGIITQTDFIGKEKEIPHSLVTIKEILGESFHNRDIEDIYKATKGKKVSEVMTTKIVSLTPESTMDSVVSQMISNHIKRIPIVEKGGKLVGIVTRRNILQAFTKL